MTGRKTSHVQYDKTYNRAEKQTTRQGDKCQGREQEDYQTQTL